MKAASDETLAPLRSAGVEAVAFQKDLRTAVGNADLFRETMAAIGRPNIAINTGGKVLKNST